MNPTFYTVLRDAASEGIEVSFIPAADGQISVFAKRGSSEFLAKSDPSPISLFGSLRMAVLSVMGELP